MAASRDWLAGTLTVCFFPSPWLTRRGLLCFIACLPLAPALCGSCSVMGTKRKPVFTHQVTPCYSEVYFSPQQETSQKYHLNYWIGTLSGLNPGHSSGNIRHQIWRIRLHHVFKSLSTNTVCLVFFLEEIPKTWLKTPINNVDEIRMCHTSFSIIVMELSLPEYGIKVLCNVKHVWSRYSSKFSGDAYFNDWVFFCATLSKICRVNSVISAPISLGVISGWKKRR